MLAHLAVAGDCNVTVPVFDGKLRFDVTGVETGRDETDPDDYGLYKGEARTCDGTFKLIAGASKEKVKARFWKKSEHEDGREPFHIWLAKPKADLPELPVRLETGSIWGNVVIHLSGWKVEDNR